MILAAAALAMTTMSAAAAPWTDSAGRVTFDAPTGWMVAPQQTQGFTYAVALGNTSECHVFASPRAETASATPDRVREAARTQLEPAAWTGIASMLPNLFPGTPIVTNQTVDTTSFWPVQSATLTNDDGHPVYGTIQFRPGVELWTFCQTFQGADETAAFDTLSHSVGTPADAALQAEAERLLEQQERMARLSRNSRANGMQMEREVHNAARPSAGGGPMTTP
jgi:hypothetical protein